MSYSLSSRNVRLENNGRELRAECKREDGSWAPSQINLDGFIGNIDGNFQWGSADYSQSAQNARLNGDHVLDAGLRREDGSWNNNGQLNLDRHIANINGVLIKNVGLPLSSHTHDLTYK